jgi:hypothetical protein
MGVKWSRQGARCCRILTLSGSSKFGFIEKKSTTNLKDVGRHSVAPNFFAQFALSPQAAMLLSLILAFAWVLMPSALAALQPRQSPTCQYTCNPTPPSTAPGGQYLDQTTDGPYIECDYFTTDLYGTGPSDYGCLYTAEGVRLESLNTVQ